MLQYIHVRVAVIVICGALGPAVYIGGYRTVSTQSISIVYSFASFVRSSISRGIAGERRGMLGCQGLEIEVGEENESVHDPTMDEIAEEERPEGIARPQLELLCLKF